MTITTLEHPATSPSLLPEGPYPFEAPGFYEFWWRHLSPALDIPYKQDDLLVYRKKMARGLIRFKEARIAGWKVAWSQDLTETRIHGLERLQQDFGWDYFRMIWTEDRDEKQRIDLLKDAGYLILQLDFQPQYVIDLSNGFEAYLKSLSHNGRKALKKKVRVAQVLNPLLVPVTEAVDIAPFYKELFSYHIPYWTEKSGSSYFSDPAERQFTIEWAKALHESGNLRLERLMLGGETASLSMGIQSGDTFYWVLTMNTGAHHDVSPGMISLALRTQALAEAGIQTFNMGTGDFFYKIQSASRLNACREVIALNPRSFKARLYHRWLLRQHPEAVRV